MAYHVRLEPGARKNLKKIPERHPERILAAIADIERNPFSGKKLEGKYKGKYVVRVWPYRIIYMVYRKQLLIVVIGIGHRQGIY